MGVLQQASVLLCSISVDNVLTILCSRKQGVDQVALLAGGSGHITMSFHMLMLSCPLPQVPHDNPLYGQVMIERWVEEQVLGRSYNRQVRPLMSLRAGVPAVASLP